MISPVAAYTGLVPRRQLSIHDEVSHLFSLFLINYKILKILRYL